MSVQPVNKPDPPAFPSGNKDLIIHRNLRSGQKLHSEGSVVVWGDVHESAEITAAGDIIILGKLGGRAHAGYYGNDNSIVFALNLVPGQIRISNKISVPAMIRLTGLPDVLFWKIEHMRPEYNSGKLPGGGGSIRSRKDAGKYQQD